MRPPNLRIGWKVWAWLFFFPAPVFAQNDAPAPAILARLDALHETVRQNLLPIELPKISCENLKTGQADREWLETYEAYVRQHIADHTLNFEVITPILTENATKLTVFACWPAPIFAPVLAADAR